MDSDNALNESFSARTHPWVQFMDFVSLFAVFVGFLVLEAGHELVGVVLLGVGAVWVFVTHPLGLVPLMMIAVVFLSGGRRLYEWLAGR